MKANEMKVKDFLSTHKTQFVIPVYNLIHLDCFFLAFKTFKIKMRHHRLKTK